VNYRLGAAVPLVLSLAMMPSAVAGHKLNKQSLVFQLWLLPTADVTAFKQTYFKALGANGWQDEFVAQATSGPIIIDSTVTIYPTVASAHAALLTVRVPGAKLISKGGGIPTSEGRIFDQLGGGRDKWTVYWRSTRVVASLSFDAAYLGDLSNFQSAGAYAVRQQKWMVAGGA
jgi:hypothetical protein